MVGPSPLGTLLIQRLDAVLGVPQSQQTNLATGARPDAVRQPDSAPRPDQVKQDLGRHPRESVDKARSQGEQGIQRAIQQGKLDVQQRLLGASTSHSSTPSAPTTLGAAARTILALLSLFPDSAPPITGRSPLLVAGGLQAGGSGTGSNSAPSGAGAAGGGQAGASAAATAQAAASQTMSGGASTSASQNGSTGSAGAGASPGPGASSAAGGAGTTSAQATATTPSSVLVGTQASALSSASPASSPLAANFSHALAQTLQNSGLFYESHLSALAFGQHRLASIQQEPQALLHQLARGASDANPPHAGARAGADPAPAGQSGAHSGTSGGAAAGAGQTLGTLHPETHLLVRQQLEVLANHAVAWRGEAWEGAPMQWEVRRATDDGSAADAGDEHWATRLVLHLPTLGQVEAKLSLYNGSVVMRLVAPDAAQTLSQHTADLRSQFLEAGLTLEQLSIQEQEHESSPISNEDRASLNSPSSSEPPV